MQVGDYLFMNGIDNANLLFVGSRFVITGDVLFYLPDNEIGNAVWCVPKLMPLLLSGRSYTGMCETDIMLLSSGIATEAFFVINATSAIGDVTAESAIELVARSLSLDIRYLPGHLDVVRAGRVWHRPTPASSIRLVEFDQIHHFISVSRNDMGSDCALSLHAEWPKEHHTVDILLQVFKPISVSPDISIFLGCSDDVLLARVQSMRSRYLNINVFHESNSKGTPTVFDTFMMNDELALLKLRLEYLKDVVDKHIIVESIKTFTGKPKRLFYQENQHLFAEYSHKIIHVILDEIFIENVTQAKQVWYNEYYSRNWLANALTSADVDAKDTDIVLVNDIDEIPHPRVIQSLLALHAHWSKLESLGMGTPHIKIHRLSTQNFMYDFSCSMDSAANNSTTGDYRQKLLSMSSPVATTFGIAKQLGAVMFPHHTVGMRIIPDEHYITLTRMFLQSAHPYPLQHVLHPGGWHLTFFGGINKIKSKLESYSHQNFVRQFIERNETDDEVTGVNISGFIVAAHGLPVLDNQGKEILHTTLPQGEVSMSRIAAKVNAGLEIDNRNRRKCSRVSDRDLDSDTLQLKVLWDNIVAAGSFD